MTAFFGVSRGRLAAGRAVVAGFLAGGRRPAARPGQQARPVRAGAAGPGGAAGGAAGGPAGAAGGATGGRSGPGGRQRGRPGARHELVADRMTGSRTDFRRRH